MHTCLSALAASSSGRCGTFVCYCWMMLRVGRCLNEDPGLLPGPRLSFSAPNLCSSPLATNEGGIEIFSVLYYIDYRFILF